MRGEYASVMDDAIAMLKKFYVAFGAHDGETMAALYADDATFGDPVFTSLRGREIGDMWRMLTKSSIDLALELGEIRPGDSANTFIAPWIARYTFTLTRRKVVNRVTSTITIENGKIVRQRDVFDFASWQRQALGLPGVLLGWTGIPGRKVQERAAKNLAAFRASNPAP
jgi:ketosteroid isomerase-like protein